MKRSLMALSLVLLPLAGCGSGEEASTDATTPAGPRLVLQTADTTNWQDVSAAIETVDQAQVMARIPGILTSLSVREGDMVKKGQVIGRIVDSQLGPQAAANKAQAVQAEAELSRVRYLYQNGVYAKARLEQAEAQAAAARANYNAVTAVAGQGAVVAPASGRVLHADIPVGAPVAPGMAVAVITAGPTIVRLELPESLADKVRVGSRVVAPEMDAAGTVTKLYPSIETGHLRADVDMPGIDNRLIGRRISARVEAGSRKALLVPMSYVTRSFGIDTVTVLNKDGSASRIPVQTAPAAEAGKVEILSGATAGDTLIGTEIKAGGA